MKLRYYTDKEIETLTKNTFINGILYKRTIKYDVVFKLWCVMMRKQFPELTAKDIFRKAGIDVTILHNDLPHKRIKSWVDNYEKFGLNYFLPELEPYHSLEKKVKREKVDVFKLKLLNLIITKLKELYKDEQN